MQQSINANGDVYCQIFHVNNNLLILIWLK